MKKIALIVATGLLFFLPGCNTIDTWGDGLPEMEHVYYIGFKKTNVNTDALTYEIAKDGTSTWRYASVAWMPGAEAFVASIPFEFHSERVRSYDAVTNFWIVNNGESALVAGVDYSVSVGTTTLTPSNGVYSFAWPQTRKGVQDVKIKRLTQTNGSLKVYVLDPAKGTPDPNEYKTSTQNNKTSEYEVRGFSFDYGKVTVNFKD